MIVCGDSRKAGNCDQLSLSLSWFLTEFASLTRLLWELKLAFQALEFLDHLDQ